MNQEYLLEVKNISKTLHGLSGSKQRVLDDINFIITGSQSCGKIISILAPPAAGKTTLLKIISAVEKPSGGEILLSGKKYADPLGEIVYIPEKPSSFPWLNVKQNIEFVIKQKSGHHNNSDDKVKKVISLVGLTGYEDHFPHEKSLGFRFRISLARALVISPKLILLDDPLKGLHGETRKEISNLIRILSERPGTAEGSKIIFILGTNSIGDAISLSETVILMARHPGRIISEIKINRENELGEHSEYFLTLKKEILKLFAGSEALSHSLNGVNHSLI